MFIKIGLLFSLMITQFAGATELTELVDALSTKAKPDSTTKIVCLSNQELDGKAQTLHNAYQITIVRNKKGRIKKVTGVASDWFSEQERDDPKDLFTSAYAVRLKANFHSRINTKRFMNISFTKAGDNSYPATFHSVTINKKTGRLASREKWESRDYGETLRVETEPCSIVK